MNGTIGTEICEGARHLYDLAQTTSESDPWMAVAQMLMAAAALAHAAKMDRKAFIEGARAAWKDVS